MNVEYTPDLTILGAYQSQNQRSTPRARTLKSRYPPSAVPNLEGNPKQRKEKEHLIRNHPENIVAEHQEDTESDLKQRGPAVRRWQRLASLIGFRGHM